MAAYILFSFHLLPKLKSVSSFGDVCDVDGRFFPQY